MCGRSMSGSITSVFGGRAGQGRAGQGRAGQGRAGQGQVRPVRLLTIQLVHIVLAGHEGIVDDTNGSTHTMHLHCTIEGLVHLQIPFAQPLQQSSLLSHSAPSNETICCSFRKRPGYLGKKRGQ